MRDILVIYGGKSTEHEIAIRSCKNILNALDRKKYHVYASYLNKEGCFSKLEEIKEEIKDEQELHKVCPNDRLASIADLTTSIAQLDYPICIPAIHGQYGEDGKIQGFLEILGINYVGSRVTSSALCMDKGYANMVLEASNIPQAKFFVLTEEEWTKKDQKALMEQMIDHCGEHLFVKPCNNGSSVGVSRCRRNNLAEGIQTAFRYDHRILIEEEILGKELEVSVLAREASDPGSYTTQREVLDYTAKYHDKNLLENVPHPLSKEKNEELKKLAMAAYDSLGCEGFARVDIFMDQEGKFYLNEINTFPGMTPSSLAPKLWTALHKMTMGDYLDKIIDYSEISQKKYGRIETSWRNE